MRVYLPKSSWNHCGKRRNCLFWEISSFVRMFSKKLFAAEASKSVCMRERVKSDLNSSPISQGGVSRNVWENVVHLVTIAWICRKKCFCLYNSNNYTNLILSHIQTLSDACVADAFWKQRGKWRNCTLRPMSRFVTLFSTLFSKYSFYCKDFPYISLYVFQCHLLQNHCMWERVKVGFNWSTAQITWRIFLFLFKVLFAACGHLNLLYTMMHPI